MRKYEIELSDEIAAALMDDQSQFCDGSSLPLDHEAIRFRAQVIVVASVTRQPDPVPERAMTLLRDIAMERAVRAAAPGESAYDTERRARGILDWILVG